MNRKLVATALAVTMTCGMIVPVASAEEGYDLTLYTIDTTDEDFVKI